MNREIEEAIKYYEHKIKYTTRRGLKPTYRQEYKTAQSALKTMEWIERRVENHKGIYFDLGEIMDKFTEYQRGEK